ncbi:cell surface protein [Methanosarcina barkeri str. Wiesmoor]|uniref:Cell surface protein n=1 Tax=Methanosarcina barkeri str. Wiesmoor TaxID=1434109 RepID=A0A0E3QLS3_METBA|nr:cell surface protein [Methanosarcina barkeri str. Wiesmoor]
MNRFLLYAAGTLIIFMYVSPCLATYNFEGIPEQDELIEATSGTVKGGLYVDGGEGLKETPYVQEFNVPGDSVKWARAYVGVWGGTEKKTGTLDFTVNGKDFESVDLEGEADKGDDEGQNPSIYCTGHGVYWVAYDVSTNISTGPVKVEVKTEGDIDGRIYGIILAAVYEDKDGEDTKYWIKEGNLNLHGEGWSGDLASTHDEGYAEFSGNIDTDKYKTATLAVAYLCGSPGLEDSLYFNDEQLSDGDNKNDIANSRSYFDLKFFDVLDFLTEDDNEVKFQRDDEDYVHPVLAALTLGTEEAGSSSDLIVSRLTLPVLCAGEDNVIKANIKNIGKDSASSFQAALYADDEVVSTATVSSLASEKNKTIEFNWKPASDGQRALKVYVDYVNKIKEKCEVNNYNVPVLAKVIDITPPEIEIKSPEDGSFVDAGEITVSGTVEDTSRNLTVDVNGKKALLSGGSWSAKVPLASGPNVIAVCAMDRANNTAKEVIVLNRKASFLRDFNESSRSMNQNNTKSANETFQISRHKDLSQNRIYLFFKKLISNWWDEVENRSIQSEPLHRLFYDGS